ncbi:MAG: CBS domain-containing protein [Planctomycetes bacterium]|jgi:CBS domain-containing protein|nr:CBS domain-containing protein [Planctomycetota bacterium]MBT5120705.1 CBS domain-containing protein [Planctomycetota bacterium]MBT7013087.1 CBS domain-containing protein [Planctomycetota bacterium]
MLTAKELMSSRLMTVAPSMTLRELLEYLRENAIHGALVKEGDRLVGVVSYTDALIFLSDISMSEESSFSMLAESDFDLSEQFVNRIDEVTVDDVMTPAVFTCDVNDTAAEVSALLLEKKIHRAVVTDNGQAIGLLSSTDLMRAVVMYEEQLAIKA